MAKKRTGLQCKISSIFSQVPVPKKGSQNSISSTSKPKYKEPDFSKSNPFEQTPMTLSKPNTVESHQRITSNRVNKTRMYKKPKHDLAKIAWLRRNKRIGSVANPNPKRQKIGMVLLFILSCLLVVVPIRNYKAHKLTSLDPVNQTISEALVASNIEIKWPIPPEYPSDIRDPMELPKEIEWPDLIVRGIVNIEDRLFAIVGGKLTGEGETVDGAKIINIDSDKVQFELNGMKRTKTKTSDLVVKGIVLGEGRPKALIGIRTVEEGNEIFSATIVRISWGSVEFEMDGKRWTQEVEGDKKRTNDIKSNQQANRYSNSGRYQSLIIFC